MAWGMQGQSSGALLDAMKSKEGAKELVGACGTDGGPMKRKEMGRGWVQVLRLCAWAAASWCVLRGGGWRLACSLLHWQRPAGGAGRPEQAKPGAGYASRHQKERVATGTSCGLEERRTGG